MRPTTIGVANLPPGSNSNTLGLLAIHGYSPKSLSSSYHPNRLELFENSQKCAIEQQIVDDRDEDELEVVSRINAYRMSGSADLVCLLNHFEGA